MKAVGGQKETSFLFHFFPSSQELSLNVNQWQISHEKGVRSWDATEIKKALKVAKIIGNK